MKKFIKKYRFLLILFIVFCMIIHLSLFTKNILTADVLLNSNYYHGYRWEISLGRFGLYLFGLLKGFMVFKEIEIFLAIFLFGISGLLLIDFFHIKNKVIQVATLLLLGSSPIFSSTLLFHYCALPYSLAFFCEIFAFYLFVHCQQKILKYLIPILLIALSLSMYQAYLSVFFTLLLLYSMIQLVKKKFSWKEFFLELAIYFLGIIVYFLCMKLSLIVFHITLDNYRGANQLSIVDIIIHIPNRLLLAYSSFYQFYFTDTIVSNTNVGIHILNIFLFLLFGLSIIYSCWKNKLNVKEILLFILFLLLLPISLNVVTILFQDTQLQLLMSSAYLLIYLFLGYFMQDNKLFIFLLCFVFLFLIRGYLIQDMATYQTLDITYQKTYTLALDIRREINKLGKEKDVLIMGNLDHNSYYHNQSIEEKAISKLTYGFVSNYSLFWDEYTNMKNGWTRFFQFYLGYPITFVDEEMYQKIKDSSSFKNMECYPDSGSIKVIDDVIVVKLEN